MKTALPFEEAFDKAQKLILEIQKLRKRKLLCLLEHNFPIGTTTSYLVNKALFRLRPGQNLDVLLDSGGGDTEEAFKIAKMFCSYATRFSTLIPFRARSTAALIALASRELLMLPGADLGPVSSPLLPITPKDYPVFYDVKENKRLYLREILSHLHASKREKILDFFLNMPHDYPITRAQCKALGLTIVKPDDALSQKMTALHETYTDALLQNRMDSALIIQTENILLFECDEKSVQACLRATHSQAEETKPSPDAPPLKQQDLPL